MAKTYVLIVSLSFTCHLPFSVSLIYYDIGGSVAEGKDKWEKGLPGNNVGLHEFKLKLLIVLFWMNRELRKEDSKIVKMYFSKRNVG